MRGVAEGCICLFNMFALLNPPLHVVSGWASASVMQDRHGGEFTRPSLSQTPALLGRLCPCFLSHCRDFPSYCPSQLSWVLITDQGHPNEMPAWLDSLCPSFSHLERKSYQSKKHFPSETDLPHTYIPLLPGTARLLLTFGLYLPQSPMTLLS